MRRPPGKYGSRLFWKTTPPQGKPRCDALDSGREKEKIIKPDSEITILFGADSHGNRLWYYHGRGTDSTNWFNGKAVRDYQVLGNKASNLSSVLKVGCIGDYYLNIKRRNG